MDVYYEVKLPMQKKQAQKRKKKTIVLGGRMTDDGKNIIVAVREGGNKVIKFIEVVDGLLGEIIEKGTPVWHKIVDFFEDILNLLPVKIEYLGVDYRLTKQPAMGKEVDSVFYLVDLDQLAFVQKEGRDIVLFMQTAQYIGKAINQMRVHLKSIGFLR